MHSTKRKNLTLDAICKSCAKYEIKIETQTRYLNEEYDGMTKINQQIDERNENRKQIYCIFKKLLKISISSKVS